MEVKECGSEDSDEERLGPAIESAAAKGKKNISLSVPRPRVPPRVRRPSVSSSGSEISDRGQRILHFARLLLLKLVPVGLWAALP